MSVGLLALSTAGVATAYPPLASFVAVMGAGMGLVMAPASTIIMETVPADQAGAGSAVNDTVREVGGALGIAVVGSIVAAVYRNRPRPGPVRSPCASSCRALCHRFDRGRQTVSPSMWAVRSVTSSLQQLTLLSRQR